MEVAAHDLHFNDDINTSIPVGQYLHRRVGRKTL